MANRLREASVVIREADVWRWYRICCVVLSLEDLGIPAPVPRRLGMIRTVGYEPRCSLRDVPSSCPATGWNAVFAVVGGLNSHHRGVLAANAHSVGVNGVAAHPGHRIQQIGHRRDGDKSRAAGNQEARAQGRLEMAPIFVLVESDSQDEPTGIGLLSGYPAAPPARYHEGRLGASSCEQKEVPHLPPGGNHSRSMGTSFYRN